MLSGSVQDQCCGSLLLVPPSFSGGPQCLPCSLPPFLSRHSLTLWIVRSTSPGQGDRANTDLGPLTRTALRGRLLKGGNMRCARQCFVSGSSCRASRSGRSFENHDCLMNNLRSLSHLQSPLLDQAEAFPRPPTHLVLQMAAAKPPRRVMSTGLRYSHAARSASINPLSDVWGVAIQIERSLLFHF